MQKKVYNLFLSDTLDRDKAHTRNNIIRKLLEIKKQTEYLAHM